MASKAVLYPNHIPTNLFQKILLASTSGIGAFFDPTKDEYIATFGETTARSALVYMRERMLDDKEGREILQKRPLINSQTVDLNALGKLPYGTFGHSYYKFLETNGVNPDSRKRVHFIDDEELAYVMQRYREVHDLVHTLVGMKTNLLGEITVKWIESLQFTLPMCTTAAVFGPWRLKPKHRRAYTTTYLPWALNAGRRSNFLLNLNFENRWEQPIADLRREVNLPDPPKGPATNAFDVSLSKTDSSINMESDTEQDEKM